MKIGSKVICINDQLQQHTITEIRRDVPNFVKKGEEYIVRDIIDHDFVVGIRLEEVVNPPKYFKVINKVIEPCFAHWRFRVLEDAKVEVEEEILEEIY